MLRHDDESRFDRPRDLDRSRPWRSAEEQRGYGGERDEGEERAWNRDTGYAARGSEWTRGAYPGQTGYAGQRDRSTGGGGLGRRSDSSLYRGEPPVRDGSERSGAPRLGGAPRVDHRGKGPKGYRRSDERIREVVCDALTDDPDVDASDVECDVTDGEVTLRGAVRTREEKRAIEQLAERATGVREVINQVRVQPRSGAGA